MSDDSALEEQLAEMVAFELDLDTVNFDSKFCPTSLGSPSPVDFYLQYLGLYLMKSDLINARFLCKRMPLKIKENASIKCLWELGRFLVRNDMKSFFARSSQVLADAKQPDILVRMVKQIRDRQLSSVTDLFFRAYSHICVDFLCDYLSISSQDVCELFLEKGWKVCPDTRFISHSGELASDNDKALCSENDTTNNDLMSRLSELMCFMENH
ncbi:unnamed protein product [Schistosoma rodhaini]|uniref:CSN8_PSD8_EIF3K domain-containing protein n=1 Tax=Schistosoma mansoni TaxID=6183 RepID=G4VAX2_SCHMA|nr:hypothetical protein Smp_025680 [Schistosoma mansoni]CAH8466173.1 unnamed protein product [Schistosoma rodhaini]|eukprot:XP_018648416.1 hypothetical protein Smp_025680 [Schistosoma mansoni]